MPDVAERHEALASESKWDFSDLRALFINCTLKRSPELSHTQGARSTSSAAIMERNGVTVEVDPRRRPRHRHRRVAGHDRARLGAATTGRRSTSGSRPPTSWCCCAPIWLGENSSVCTQVIERLYGNSHLLNDAGQYAYYGRVGGCLITGNEDGVKHCAMNILYSLQHLGYTIPPQADAGWIGEAGPGPSYLDPGSGGPENDFTNRNTTFMTWNLLHLARMLKDAGGIPAHGNQRSRVGRRLPLRLRQPRAPLDAQATPKLIARRRRAPPSDRSACRSARVEQPP